MILIKNKVRRYPIDQKRLQRTIKAILDILGYSDFSIGILLTTNATIRRYNREFRHKDKPTDILSFPYHPTLRAGERIKPYSEDDKNLGDIIISLAYVAHDAQKRGIAFDQWFDQIMIHGICHLLGYDHISDKDYRTMRAQEIFILQKIKTCVV